VQRAGFGLRNGLRSIGQEMIDHALAGGLQVGKRHDLVHETDAMRLFSIEAFSSERVAPYLAHADSIVSCGR
jgi:hypothetical protein